MISFSIPVPRIFARPILWMCRFYHERYVVLVCKGFDDDDDDELFTGLDWREDQEIIPYVWYDFQIWVRL